VAKNWDAIKADFCSGMTLGAICSKHGIRMGELFARIRNEGWKRERSDGAGSPPPSQPPDKGAATQEPERAPVVHFPVLIDQKASDAIDAAAAETVAAVIDAHKEIGAELRRHFKRELAEYDGMVRFFATFQDKAHIETLLAKNDGGVELRQYLQQALAHSRQRADAHGRLVQTGRQVVELERAVWGLDEASDGASELSYDDLLEQLQKPLAPRELPRNVLDFEQRVLRKRKPGDRG
jgi:hypothetical protein